MSEKKTVGRFLRLTAETDKKLTNLRRKLSVEKQRDLSAGDVIALALEALESK